MIDKQEIAGFSRQYEQIRLEIAKEMIGQEDVVEHLLLAVIAGGNVLLEGVPGLGKTHLVRTLAKALDLPFSRIQFTPDLMPADITGTTILEKTESGSAFRFQPGPLFAAIVLADEINRATPKTQSALLEAMQEHAVTVSGQTRPLPEPYFVLATQNPVEQEGTYPLPEAQLDGYDGEGADGVCAAGCVRGGYSADAAGGPAGAHRPGCGGLCPAPGAGHPSGSPGCAGDCKTLPALWGQPPGGPGHFVHGPGAGAASGAV